MTTRVPIGAGMNLPTRISFFLLFCGILPALVAADDLVPRGGVRVVRPAPEASERESVDERVERFGEDSERLLTRDVLDTGELLQVMGERRYREEFLQRFPEIVKTTVQPTEWEEVGGSCRLEPTGQPRDGRFVLTASPSVRREIMTLIRTMTDATKAKSPVSMVPFLTENAAALNAVERPVTLDVVDVPLYKVLREIGRQIRMPIALDARSLEEMGVMTDEPVTDRCRGLRASDALARILRNLELTWQCLGGGLMVTHQETAMIRQSTAVFDVHDLVMCVDGTPDLDSLHDMITTTIDPSSWDSVGGPGSLHAVRLEKHTLLVVSQTQEVLREIKSLFDRARRAKKEHHPVLRPRREDWAAFAKVLDGLVRWHFDEVPLDEATAAVSATLGVDVYLDRRSFDEMGVEADMPVSLPDGEYVAGDALARMLRPHELTCLVAHGGLVITHCQTAMNRLDTVLFDVTDLVIMSDGTRDLDSLFDIVTTTIDPCSWDCVGGAGSLDAMCLEEHTLLVVSQTQEVLQEIESLFDRVRRAKKEYHPILRPRREEWAAFAKVLDRRVRWYFDDVPLDEAITTISATLGVDVYLDCRSFEEMGIRTDAPVSLPAGEYVAKDALARMLRPHESTYLVAHGGLTIIHWETAMSRLDTVLFDVSDLLLSGEEDSRHGAHPVEISGGTTYVQFGGPSRCDFGAAADYDSLIDCVVTLICPTTWDSVGGPGSIKEMEAEKQAFLVVSQTQEVLDMVVSLLEALRKIQKTKAPAVIIESNTDAAVRKALDKRVAWSFNETPLSHAIVRISADLGVDIAVDSRSFTEMGVDADRVRLSLPFLYFNAREALRRSLEPHNLSFFIRNGALMIATKETVRNRLREAVFNITDLLAAEKATEDGLIEAICRIVQPETWDCVGGVGALRTLDLPGGRTVLVVSQTEEVLHEVERRLERLRKQ